VRLREAPFTYPEIGATAGELPRGYRHVCRSALLGSGARVFAEAADALMSWQVQLRAGLEVAASDPVPAAGTVVLLRLRIAFLQFKVPCRVVYVVGEPDRRGFAYGTLAGHQENGEEAFIVSQDESGAVRLVITAFSRPAAPLARVAGPAGRLTQNVITDRYLRALVR
jgi:uncharacterized protein (UPF0548 family)